MWARDLHMRSGMSIRYHSQTVRRETLHTVALVAPHVNCETAVLDVGCGDGYVAAEIAARAVREVRAVDIGDYRRVKTIPFDLYDGQSLPFPDQRFELVMLSFVLHHVPDPLKPRLIREALRVSRAKVFILEDTPVTPLDRFVSHRHGEAYRKKIDSRAPYGFLTPTEWRWLFRGMGLEAEDQRLSRFCRSVWQPFARTSFLLRKSPPSGARATDRPAGTSAAV